MFYYICILLKKTCCTNNKSTKYYFIGPSYSDLFSLLWGFTIFHRIRIEIVHMVFRIIYSIQLKLHMILGYSYYILPSFHSYSDNWLFFCRPIYIEIIDCFFVKKTINYHYMAWREYIFFSFKAIFNKILNLIVLQAETSS